MITTDDHAANPYKVVFADGQVSGWLRPDSIKSSGLNMSFELEMAMAASAHEVRAACESKLPEATQPAVRPGRVILSEAEVLFIKAEARRSARSSTTGVVPIDDLLATSATPRL